MSVCQIDLDIDLTVGEYDGQICSWEIRGFDEFSFFFGPLPMELYVLEILQYYQK